QEAELARDRDATIVRVRSLIGAKELDEAAKTIAGAVARGVPITALASIKQLLDAAQDRRAAEVERERQHALRPDTTLEVPAIDPGHARARIIRLTAAGIVVAAIVIGGYMAWPAIFKPPPPPPPP